jgi:hypothetical protein
MRRILATVLGLSLMTAACADPTAPPTPVPVAPTILEPPITGTLLVLGSNVHQFTVNQVGGLQVTINSVVPSAAIGVGVGTPSTATGTCLVLSGLTVVAGPGAQLSGTATVPGSFCINVYDVGNLVEPVNYTITVLHS